jgi:acetyl-CoA carboxylase biotin carboxyl carrier protein
VELELKQIKELMTAMGRSGMTKLILKLGDRELHLERHAEPEATEGHLSAARSFAHEATMHEFPRHQPLVQHGHPTFPNQQGAGQSGAASANGGETSFKAAEGRFITAPMVGTFYRGPAPEDPAFIKVGDTVEPTTVVCIVEAMKVMNEVKAGVGGVVAEILVDNGHPVEFGTKLFRLT